MVLQPINLPGTALTGTDALQLRRDAVTPVNNYARAPDNLSPVTININQAVVINFGAQALNLARNTSPITTDGTDATAPSVFDTDEANAALQPRTTTEGTQALLDNVFGPNQTNAALISTLDINAQQALLQTP